MSELNAQQTAALLTIPDANPSLAQIAAGTSLDYSRADLRAGLTSLLRMTRLALAELDGPVGIPAPRPRGTTGYRHPLASPIRMEIAS
jgi:hypothetical protein